MGASQSHGLKLASVATQENLRGCHQPSARLGGGDEGDEETRIHLAGFQEELLRLDVGAGLTSHLRASRQDNLVELAFFELLMESLEVLGVCLFLLFAGKRYLSLLDCHFGFQLDMLHYVGAHQENRTLF